MDHKSTTPASARDAVNAAASRANARPMKSASNLHHGSIRRSMESTRVSASAMLVPKRQAPVVHTSLKLGAAARPKVDPIVLPPNSRMAQAARPVHSITKSASDPKPLATPTSSKITKFSRRTVIDSQIISPHHAIPSGISANANISQNTKSENTKPKSLPSGQSQTVPIVATSPDSTSSARPNRPSSHPDQTTVDKPPVHPSSAKRAVRDPQMLSARRSRLRAKPKRPSTTQPITPPVDDSYIMLAPPKLRPRHATIPAEDFVTDDVTENPATNSQAENHISNDHIKEAQISNSHTEAGSRADGHQPNKDHATDNHDIDDQYIADLLQTVGDLAPTGHLKAQKVAAGHVSATQEFADIKDEDATSFGFGRKKSEPTTSRRAISGESPFLRSVNVEKRPLSNSPEKLNPRIKRSTIPRTAETSKSSTKSGLRLPSFKRSATSSDQQDLPVRPTVIVPSNRRSKAPFVFLIFITIILGLAVGAAVYLCFFQ